MALTQQISTDHTLLKLRLSHFQGFGLLTNHLFTRAVRPDHWRCHGDAIFCGATWDAWSVHVVTFSAFSTERPHERLKRCCPVVSHSAMPLYIKLITHVSTSFSRSDVRFWSIDNNSEYKNTFAAIRTGWAWKNSHSHQMVTRFSSFHVGVALCKQTTLTEN